MSRFYWVTEDRAATARHGGYVDARHTWGLPGVRCHVCGATWSAVGHDFPSVDLSGLPESRELVTLRPEPFAEFVRRRELVRPYMPAGVALPPGTDFGPLIGRAVGGLGPVVWSGTRMLLRHDALERLHAEGVFGLMGCPTSLRFRQKDPPELMELQLEPLGRFRPDCIPADVPPPCPTCGRFGLSRPEAPILDAATLPTEVDLFRVGNFATMVIGTERFRDSVLRLELDGLTFRELPSL
ncbi:double-CXXCG motif protein [Myxococcus faecalis]|uniref:SitI6 family double-CXXCG motif immunity protein n=1 Tax=Myxococcus faecalis TaxID=3115646 RepID=UPI0038D118A1